MLTPLIEFILRDLYSSFLNETFKISVSNKTRKIFKLVTRKLAGLRTLVCYMRKLYNLISCDLTSTSVLENVIPIFKNYVTKNLFGIVCMPSDV